MKSVISYTNWITSIATLLIIIHHCHSYREFQCPDKGTLPEFPLAYSTNIRINFEKQLYTVEVKHAVNTKEQKELMELRMADRRVKYISRGDQKSMLVITYKENESPKCVVKKSVEVDSFFESADAGPNGILNKMRDVIEQSNKFGNFGPDMVNSIFVQTFEGCFSKINVSISFSGPDWKNSYDSSLNKKANYPVFADAQINEVYMTAQFYNFDPTDPDDALFQPTPDVYCDGFRTDKSPPKILDYFSYDAEIIKYENSFGIAPSVSPLKVYYDYPAGIARKYFYEPLDKDSDMFLQISARERSIIHDFNAGVQYIIDPFTGKCTQDNFESAFSVIASDKIENSGMLKGTEFFWIDNVKTSYNGQFPVRGIMADVYTAISVDPETKKNSLVSWYFSTEETRMVGTETVEKNVLLRMTVRPVTNAEGDLEGVKVIHFYNFASEQPSVLKYDITSCYNDSNSKILVLTFPAHSLLQGYEKFIGILVHLAIKDTTGIAKQRLVVREVVFSGNYMYAEFELLGTAASSSKVQNPDLKISLDDALSKLRNALSIGNFSVKVPVGKQIIVLRPEPDGLNVFAGDRVRKPSVIGYKEGSVIGLTIGMLILGFVLGGVTINLVISRKLGVSLFQKAKYGNQPFDNSRGESSM